MTPESTLVPHSTDVVIWAQPHHLLVYHNGGEPWVGWAVQDTEEMDRGPSGQDLVGPEFGQAAMTVRAWGGACLLWASPGTALGSTGQYSLREAWGWGRGVGRASGPGWSHEFRCGGQSGGPVSWGGLDLGFPHGMSI
jgi:hypothetical protein